MNENRRVAGFEELLAQLEVETETTQAEANQPIPIYRLLDYKNLGLRVVAGERRMEKLITSAEINRPSLELTGFFDRFRPERIQILGSGEVAYLERIPQEPDILTNLEHIFSYDIPCVIVSNDLPAPQALVDLGERYHTPILVSPHSTTKLSKRVWETLDQFFAPRTRIHGVLVDVYGQGVLILGKSGVGKSECALELVSKGQVLVADDVVEVKCVASSILMGQGVHAVPFHMEIRGLGIIDVNRTFGARAIRERKRINLVVVLEEWTDRDEYERIGLEERYAEILDVEVPCLVIPVKPGRNISTIVEVGALNQKLRKMGINPARELNTTLQALMQQKRAAARKPS